jgi:hypothetical protein
MIVSIVKPVIYGLRINVMTQLVNSVPIDQKNQTGAFRHWVRELWMSNCDERLTYGQDPATMKQYWDTYKWWIKREYKHQRLKNV